MENELSEPAVVSWSGGKDSVLALHRVLAERTHKIESLITTVTSGYDRISMHGVRVELLQEQARSIGLPLKLCFIPPGATNAEYEEAMIRCLVPFAANGVKQVICGDLFLSDIREYREKLFARVGMEGAYPLWLEHTGVLAREFIMLGYKAALCCVDPRAVPDSFAGRDYDDSLLADLGDECDPCGENGEFHSFVYDGPIFGFPVGIEKGESVTRDGFRFTDLAPSASPRTPM